MRRACDNPFAVDRVLRERYRMDDAGWSSLLARLDRLGRRGAIVGSHGSGKTTLLEDLADRLAARGWRVHLRRLDSEHRSLPRRPSIDGNDFVLCDGAEQLGAASWIRLRLYAARAAGLVITTHRAGRLSTLHQCATSPAIVSDLVSSLGSPLSIDEARALHQRHRGNVRDALRELYDRWSVGAA
jgi:ABC-type cobalamin/Fe3+-siderophores transport system ATPase subunit